MTPNFAELGQRIGMLVAEKNRQYGNTWHTCAEVLRVLYPARIKPDQYITAMLVVRIVDKLGRVATGALEDSFEDIAGYGILGASLPKHPASRPRNRRKR